MRGFFAPLPRRLALGLLFLVAAGCGGPAEAPTYRVDAAGGKRRAFRVTAPGEIGASTPARRQTIDLGSERRRARPARPAPAGVERLDFTVELSTTGLPEGDRARLRFAYGRLSPARFRLLSGVGGGATAPAGAVEFRVEEISEGDLATRFAASLEPVDGTAQPERWHEGAIEVVADSSVRRFRFRTVGAAPEGTVFWGDVHVEPAHVATPRSALLISIDTLRADRLSLYGRRAAVTTPRLDAWARRRAVAFSDAVAASPWTLPSHASIFSGLDATRHGVNHEERIDGVRYAATARAVPYLAELLRDAGIRSGAATGSGLLAPQFGFAAGFDVYRWWPGVYTDPEELLDATRRALDWLRRHSGQPTFFFLHTYRVHSPFEFPEIAPEPKATAALDIRFNAPLVEDGFRNQRGRLVEVDAHGRQIRPTGDLDRLSRAYDDGVAGADAAIGELLETLERERLDLGLTVVVTSDHGEALGEDGRLGHHDLFTPTLAVPLLIATPGGSPRIVTRQVRHVDLLPTLLDALDVPVPDGLDGVSLLPFASGGEVAVPDLAWSYSGAWNYGLALHRADGFKLLLDDTAWHVPGRARAVAFDRRADPEERHPLAAQALLGVAGVAGDGSDPRALGKRKLREATGLWVRLQNGGRSPLRLILRGPGVLDDAVKHDLSPGLTVAWRELGVAEVEIAAGAAGELRLPRVPFHGLKVRAAAFAARLRELTISPRELAEAPVLILDGTRWQPMSRPLRPGESGIAFEWRGPIRRAPELPDPVDADTEEQLRALGYLQ